MLLMLGLERTFAGRKMQLNGSHFGQEAGGKNTGSKVLLAETMDVQT